MNPHHRIDSAQAVSAIGAFLGFIGANFDRVAATLCALVGVAYTIWKWRRESKKAETRTPFDEKKP